jgi:hypothetical protein
MTETRCEENKSIKNLYFLTTSKIILNPLSMVVLRLFKKFQQVIFKQKKERMCRYTFYLSMTILTVNFLEFPKKEPSER